MRRETRLRMVAQHRFLGSPVVAGISLALAVLLTSVALFYRAYRARRAIDDVPPVAGSIEPAPAAPVPAPVGPTPAAPRQVAGPAPGAAAAATSRPSQGPPILDPDRYRDGMEPPEESVPARTEPELRVLTAVAPDGLGDDRPPLNPGALWQLDPDAAHVAPKDALQEMPVSMLYDRATAAILSKDLERAVRYLRIAREKDPEDPTIAAWLGLVLADLQQFDEAMPLLEQAVRREIAVEACSIQLARIAASRNDRDRACAILAELIRQNPLAPELYHDLAVLQAGKQDVTGAIMNMRSFLRLRPEDAVARERLIEWLLVAGRNEELVQEVRALVAGLPDSDPNLARCALPLIQAKQFAPAIELLERHISAVPDQALSARRFLSAALLRSRDLDGAIESLQASLARHPDDFVLRFNLACGFSLRGEPAQALEQVQILARNAPVLLAGTLDDPDLASLREDPAGAAWITEFRARQAPPPAAPAAPGDTMAPQSASASS